jgi:hypothetical protein
MNVGESNRNGQVLLEKTKRKSSTHPFARIWKMRCSRGHTYGSNSCDAHERKCAKCNPDAKPGEPI